jgi:hypothetical protein
MGRVEKLDADAPNPEQYLRRQSYGWWFARGNGKARKLELRGPRRQAGIDYAVVRVTPQRGEPFDFWINTASGRVERRQEVVDGKLLTAFPFEISASTTASLQAEPPRLRYNAVVDAAKQPLDRRLVALPSHDQSRHSPATADGV